MSLRSFAIYHVSAVTDRAVTLVASDGSHVEVRRESLPSGIQVDDTVQAVPRAACGIGFQLLRPAGDGEA